MENDHGRSGRAAKLQQLQAIAQDLGFIQVGEIIVLTGKDCAIDMNDGGDDPYIQLKIHASEITGVDEKEHSLLKRPSSPKILLAN
ncbi:MAG: hypothetical protein HC860_26685 [Alkalinema sp. RU_4_3]|nr:hypothetical protein [Alkalinema sp. RU_4_3]